MSNINTACPSAYGLRQILEHHVLDIYEPDGVTLKAYTEWPGHYWLPDSNRRIPAVFVVGAEQVPSKWEPHGIECTVYDVPEPARQPSRGCVITKDRWRVRFTNYGYAEGTTVATSLLAISRMITSVFNAAQQVYTERNEVTYENLVVYISETTVNPVYSPT